MKAAQTGEPPNVTIYWAVNDVTFQKEGPKNSGSEAKKIRQTLRQRHAPI